MRAVAGEESDRDGFTGGRRGVFEDGDGRGGTAVGGVDDEDRGLFEVGQVFETGAAYYADVDGALDLLD